MERLQKNATLSAKFIRVIRFAEFNPSQRERRGTVIRQDDYQIEQRFSASCRVPLTCLSEKDQEKKYESILIYRQGLDTQMAQHRVHRTCLENLDQNVVVYIQDLLNE